MALSISSLPEADAAASDRTWTSQVADDDYYGHDLVMTADAQGYLHLLFYDCVNGDLYYTHLTAGGWETVYLCYNGLYEPSLIVNMNAIAVDSLNRVHVVFSDYKGELYHISDASVPSTLAPLGESGMAPSLAAGMDGSIHLSYVGTDGHLRYQSFNGAWSPTVIVDETLATVSTTSTSIAVSPSGEIHIAYTDSFTGELRYAFKQAGSWTSYSLGVGAYGIEEVDLALDSMGDPHIAYRVSGSNDLWYCHNNGGGWAFTAIDSASDVRGSVSIAIGDGDVAYIAYDHFDYQNSRVKFATNEGGMWTTSIIDDSMVAVNGAAIAVLPDGSVGVCTLDDANSVIYYRGTVSNTAPTITTVPSTSGRESVAYSYAPSADMAVSWSVRTNAPFLAWSGTAVTGTPGLNAAGTYWVNITATVSASSQYDYQNYSLTIGDSWSPHLENEPGNGQETVGYAFEPQYNETVTVTAHSTSAPFLTWDGSKFVGTPDIGDAGTYWINITAMSVNGLLSSYQNATIVIGEAWVPEFTNTPADGQETVDYNFAPSHNETVSIMALSTNAPFLAWNGNAYVGTPGTSDAGTYWVNISVRSVNGLLTDYRNWTFVIAESWAPTFVSAPPEEGLFATMVYGYHVHVNETAVLGLETDASFLSLEDGVISGTLAAGTYYVNVTATSAAGHLMAWQNYTLTVVEDGDEPTVEITSPADGALLNSTEVIVSWTSADSGSGTAGAWYRVDGGEWIGLVSAGLVLDLAEGDHLIEVRAKDRVGNEMTKAVTIHIDTTVPTVVSSAPRGDNVSLDRSLTVTFSEAMNQTSVVVTVNGQPFTLTWKGNNATLAGDWKYDTVYTVVVIGSDLSGTALSPNTWTFRTEVQQVTVEGVVLDADGQPVAGATIFVGGSMVAMSDADGAYRFTLPPGSYNATVSGDGFLDKEVGLQVVGASITMNVAMDKANLANPYQWIWPILMVIVVCVITYAAYRVRKN